MSTPNPIAVEAMTILSDPYATVEQYRSTVRRIYELAMSVNAGATPSAQGATESAQHSSSSSSSILPASDYERFVADPDRKRLVEDEYRRLEREENELSALPVRDGLIALIAKWRTEARRLDSLGGKYWAGEGAPHPPEWIITTELRKRADELEAALSAAGREASTQGWQPIETAPKDGMSFVGGMTHRTWGWLWGRVRWHNDRHAEGGGYFAGDGIQPTHWMPLPSSPSSGETGPQQQTDPPRSAERRRK